MKIVSGILREPNLHDGALLALEYAPNHQINLRVRDEYSGRVYVIHLLGVDDFRGDGFMKGSIILDITICTQKKLKPGAIAEAFKMEGHFPSDLFVANAIAKVEQGELTLFQLNPSYGAWLSCLCESVEIHEI